jgi:hypothetical protein
VHAILKQKERKEPEMGFKNNNMLYKKGGAIIGKPIFDMKDSQKVGSEFFCLLVHQGFGKSTGLVLERVEGRTTEYRRIGYLVVVSERRGPDGRTAFADINLQVLTII